VPFAKLAHALKGQPTKMPVHPSRSRFGSVLVIVCAVFLSLALMQEILLPGLQAWIASALSNWMAMGAVAFGLWGIRRGWLAPLPPFAQALAGLLALSFALISVLGILRWQPLWALLGGFGISQEAALPIALFAVFAAWLLALAVLLIRGFFRWMGKRYEHHGVAVGFGPLYFYFRRRKAS
jgi:hypothetical protein